MSSRRIVYMDYSATTPTDTRVVEAMLPYFSDVFGNTSSAHHFGRRAEYAVEEARQTIARIMNCKPNEIVFTSGGSESDNLAVRQFAKRSGQRSALLTTRTEHSAVGKTMLEVAQLCDYELITVPVDEQGMVDQQQYEALLQERRVAFVSIIYANNEVGTVQDIPQLAQTARKHGALFHTDAVQAAGQLSLDVQALGVDMLSLSAHKFYGPKGVGALYVREGTPFHAVQTGGSHEEDRRAGTLNTPGIVGMAKALQLAYEEREQRLVHYHHLRCMLIEQMMQRVPGARLTGHPERRLPSHASFIIDGVDANQLLIHLDMRGVAASSASACKTGNPEPSGVLLALGYDRQQALGSLRLSVGTQTSEEDVEYVVQAVAESVEALRQLRKALAR
ncbi:MAG: cysteine desulfurase family protein [Anaerolineae bacterium]|nr:cysteine desulfurase family protein [Anaerolineae bacterium]